MTLALSPIPRFNGLGCRQFCLAVRPLRDGRNLGHSPKHGLSQGWRASYQIQVGNPEAVPKTQARLRFNWLGASYQMHREIQGQSPKDTGRVRIWELDVK